MEKYQINKRNFLITGLTAIALLATVGCQTLKIEPIYYPDNREVYIDARNINQNKSKVLYIPERGDSSLCNNIKY